MGSGQAKSSKPRSGILTSSRRRKTAIGRSILLLGTAGVGKTTIVKQLTMSLGSGLTEEKKMHLKHSLRACCVKRLVDIINFAANDEDDAENEGNELPASAPKPDDEWLFEKGEEMGMVNLTSISGEDMAKVGVELARMWKSALVQSIAAKVITQDHETALLHACADRFLPEVERIFSAGFELSQNEFVHVRCPTNDIETTHFTHHRQDWCVKDVGGQIHHRHTWKTAFDGISVVLFIVSLSDYDRFSGKDKKNLLLESRKLFKDVCGDPTLKGRPFVLLFNKKDVFEQKLKTTPLSVCKQFKDIEKRSDETDADFKDRCCHEIFKYYKKAYRDVLSDVNGEKSDLPLEYFQTCATDKDFIETSMKNIFKSILTATTGYMQNSGW